VLDFFLWRRPNHGGRLHSQHNISGWWLSLRAYWQTAALASTNQIGDGPVYLLRHGLRFIRVLVLLSLWHVVFEGHDSVSGMTLTDVLTYTLIAEVFAEQLSVRTRLLTHIWEGQIAIKLMAPRSLVGQISAETVGGWGPGLLLTSLPLLALSPLVADVPLPADSVALGYFTLSLLLAINVGFAIDFIFGALTVALGQSVWLIEQMRAAFVLLLSGAVLPFALLPLGIGRVLGWTPFGSTASAPLRLYTDTSDALPILGLQVFWGAATWVLAYAMWQHFRERLAGNGG